jgi:hypothetical protein
MIILGVDLNHRSPGYEPGGMDLATLPRSGKMMFSANLNVSDHSGVLRLSPAMKRQNRTQQEGPLESRKIATISMICIRP